MSHSSRYSSRPRPASLTNWVFISFDELLPAAREYGEHHLSLYGLIIGMIVIAISLVFFSIDFILVE